MQNPSTSLSLASSVSFAGIEAARAVVYPTLTPTPLAEYPLLNEAVGLNVWLKHENHLPTGAFKIRGGLNFMSHFAREHAGRGVISATRGNHGQSIAVAAARYDVAATIVAPHGNNPEKNAAMRAQGARLIEHGANFAESVEEAHRLAETENLYFIHSAHPHLIHGVGTYALEIIETAKSRDLTIDAVCVPIGMGSGLCGVITAFRALSPHTRIYGVQATNAPCYYLSLKAGQIISTETCNTFADGIATSRPAELPFEIIKGMGQQGVDEIILVSDEEIAEAIRLLWRTTHQMPEGAGAAATAATMQRATEWRGQTVVNILTGGNLDTDTLRRVFAV
ncbi:MAG: threonine dehydratase [Acidobacteria bacterium]|nr:threonine dehydratase [Acidobacteriota bacterium]